MATVQLDSDIAELRKSQVSVNKMAKKSGHKTIDFSELIKVAEKVRDEMNNLPLKCAFGEKIASAKADFQHYMAQYANKMG